MVEKELSRRAAARGRQEQPGPNPAQVSAFLKAHPSTMFTKLPRTVSFITLLLLFVAVPFARAQRPDDLLTKENLGGIKIGMTAKALGAILGKASIKKGPSKEENREGFETWDCPENGLSIEMSSREGNQGRTVSRFIAKKKCPFATAKGIKIGSTLAEVRKAYGTLHENGPNQFLAGNAADAVGIFFTIKDGKVSEIFFGVAA